MKLCLSPESTSVIIHVFAQDTTVTDGSGKTGIAFGDVTAYYMRAGETLTAMTTETIATLGTWASTGSDKLGVKLVHNTNAPGLLELDLPDNIFAVGSNQVTICLRGTGFFIAPIEIQLASAPANVRHWVGDSISSGTMSGVPIVDVGSILGTAVTESVAGQLAGAFTVFFDITSPTGTANVIPLVTDISTKSGYELAATGLDSITVTTPAGLATTFTEKMNAIWAWMYNKKDMTSTLWQFYNDAGDTVILEQALSDDTVTQTVGVAAAP